MRVASVRLAYETNSCLKQVAQSLAEEDSGLILELELSLQDARLLVAEVNGPRETVQNKPPVGKNATAHKKLQPEAKQPAAVVQVYIYRFFCIHIVINLCWGNQEGTSCCRMRSREAASQVASSLA